MLIDINSLNQFIIKQNKIISSESVLQYFKKFLKSSESVIDKVSYHTDAGSDELQAVSRIYYFLAWCFGRGYLSEKGKEVYDLGKNDDSLYVGTELFKPEVANLFTKMYDEYLKLMNNKTPEEIMRSYSYTLGNLFHKYNNDSVSKNTKMVSLKNKAQAKDINTYLSISKTTITSLVNESIEMGYKKRKDYKLWNEDPYLSQAERQEKFNALNELKNVNPDSIDLDNMGNYEFSYYRNTYSDIIGHVLTLSVSKNNTIKILLDG